MKGRVCALLVAVVVVMAAAILGLSSSSSAHACGRIPLTRDSMQSYVDYSAAVVIGTFGTASGDVITLKVEEGLKGSVRSGDTITVVNQDIDDCPTPYVYDDGRPYSAGMHVLALLLHEGLGTGAEWRVSPAPGGVALYDGVRYFVAPIGFPEPLPSLSEMKRRITTTQAAINPALEDERPCNGGEALLDDPLMLNQLSYVVAVGTFGPGDDETIDFTPDDIWRGKVANGAHLRIDNRYYGASATSCERPVAGGGKFQAGERALLFLRPDVHQNDGGWEIAGWHTQAYWVAGDNLSYAPMPTLERLRAEAAASVSPEPPANDNLHPGKIALVVLLSAVVACATLYVVSKPGRASP